MKNLSIRMKLTAGFGVVLLLLGTVGFFSYTTISQLSGMSGQVDERGMKVERSYAIEAAIEQQTAGVRGFLLAGGEDLLKQDENGKNQYHEELTILLNTVGTDAGKRALSEIPRAYDAYRSVLDLEVQLRRAGKTTDATSLASSAHTSELRGELRKAVHDFILDQQQKKGEVLKQQAAIEKNAGIFVAALSLAALALGTVATLFLSRSLSARVASMVRMMQEIASNNLGVDDIPVTCEDELGRANRALNIMKNNLRAMIQSIAQTAEHLASASEQISSSAAEQAQSAETQKDQASQVATAMQEMSSTVQQVSENSNRAAEASRQAAETALHGGGTVDETLAKMRMIASAVSGTAKKVEELGKRSDEIGRIVGVIDDIADQTNLLALNAAIEAARAGEQGRGFAVVADEVRKLAERTTSATKEIAHMIKNIQDETRLAVTAMETGTRQVEEGVTSTAEAGKSLKQIIDMAEQVGEMITHIATAATEQASASEQVNQSMDQIALLIHESAAGSQEAAKACQHLSGLALDLQKMVSDFQLGQVKPHGGVEQAPTNPARAWAASAH
ncbi:MAG: methyl-accepting chemotaxis protein [Acidobacteriia bacterium]|nr:methyl-accepting chemotaxis protein [Terriglobia bacterium]